MKKLASLLAVTSLLGGALSLPAFAEHHAEQAPAVFDVGVKVGETIPMAEGGLLSVIGSDGEKADFDSLKGDKGLVVAFVRSADWCPYCKKQMIDLDAIAESVATQGYPLVAVSYDAPEKLAKFKMKNELSYTLASDTGSANIKAFGLLNDAYKEGSKAHGVPHPAVYIIDNEGVVKAKLMEEGFKNRPASEVVFQAVDVVSKAVSE
ncbi:peroxiredoxin family protein [Hirschia litorea]|uniref:thioredoxin-dependent peroxiredoxin n=1 Tax=Hirschia litorea TaxID=1199156 RepID=A0ABW2IK41_9PROT